MICSALEIDQFIQDSWDWDKAPWKNTQAYLLTHYMGERPSHFPQTRVKLVYDSDALYLMFQVQDQYVRAQALRDQDPVCQDSCVEFFFIPHSDKSLGYFNLEINCGGTLLFHFQKEPRKNPVVLSEQICRKMNRFHSLPKTVDPEIKTPVQWEVGCRIPFDLLTPFARVVKPGPGAVWQVNFYKCADKSSHPHWLTWAPVDHPVPDFHRPGCFGRLHFKG